MANPRARFAEGDSVRCAVATVDAARGRVMLSLRHSATGAPDAAFVAALLADLEAAERLRRAPSSMSVCIEGLLSAPLCS